MIVLGIESSCDECSVAVVRNGNEVLSLVTAAQIEEHRPFYGVVPEIASRLHTEHIFGVVDAALRKSGYAKEELDGVAVTNQPGLMGSLLVGLSFAKGFAWSLGKSLVTVDHILGHLYAPHLETEIPYPYLGLLVSGGHTLIVRVDDFDTIEVLGSTIDDACGEAFDKVAKHFDMGFPGGVAIDKLSRSGDPTAYKFPHPKISDKARPYDVSYSGLKTAVILQNERFLQKGQAASPENLAASFQRTAIEILCKRVIEAVRNTGLKRVVAGGGVAANSALRGILSSNTDFETFFPSLTYCTDNGAMIAGIGCRLLERKRFAPWNSAAYSRVSQFGSGQEKRR